MKSSWFANPKRYQFAKCLRDADYTRQPHELFRLWLTCAHAAMRQPVNKLLGLGIVQKLEDEYEKARSTVKHPERFAEAFAILTMGLEDDAHDFLGCVAGEWGLLSSDQSQFFTPASLCDLMARMVIADAKPQDGRTLALSEPACGGGATIIASCKVLWDRGFFPWHYHWTAVDLDWRMFATCYVQLSLLGIPAGVIQGNTLTLETYDSARTIAGVMHPPKRNAYQIGESETVEAEAEAAEPDQEEPAPILSYDDVPTLAQGMLF